MSHHGNFIYFTFISKSSVKGKSNDKRSTVREALLALDWHMVDRQPIIFDAALKVTVEMCQLPLQSWPVIHRMVQQLV